MSKLMDIIDRRLDERLNKMGELKLVPAQVTAVRADFLRADVKLLANGAEIKDMLNKTAEKLTVGQTVTIGYQTLPSSGVIMFANGEADLIRQGGGVEVETAALLDEDNVHHWLADQELMLDIDAETRLLYGGNQRLVSVQGHVCRFGRNVNLTDSDANKFGSTLLLDVWMRESSGSPYVQRRIKFNTFINYMDTNGTGGAGRCSFGLIVSCYSLSDLLSPMWEETYTSNYITGDGNVMTPLIVPTVLSMSFATSYSDSWGGVDTLSTPYGYVKADQLIIYCGCAHYLQPITPGGEPRYVDFTVSKWKTNTYEVDVYACGRGHNQTHQCLALESDAEGCFDIGLVQRSTPVTPST